MCGIAGIVDFDRPIAHGPLGAMLGHMVHRGPDDEGRYHQGPYAIGMRRLSIIDLAGGHQPLSNEDGTIWVVLNGEIYNYVELREDLEKRGHVFKTRTDTEVLVHLYEDLGERFPEKLNGMFGLAVWDTRRRRIVLARDHLGIKPLYWHFASGRLTFASELKCLLAAGVPPEVDRDAIAAYLHLGYIPREGSPIRGIHKLQPGSALVFNEGRPPAASAYWRLSAAFARPRDVSVDEAAEEAARLIHDAVRLQLRSDVPVGTFLSGGIDSSAITAEAASLLPRIDTFGVGFTGHYFDETGYARAVAQHCGTRHHEQMVNPATLVENLALLSWHLDEPNSDPAMLPSYVICRYAREHVKVVLSGNGGDEVFGGYPRHYDAPARATVADRARLWLPRGVRATAARVMGLASDERGRRFSADADVVGMLHWVEQARRPAVGAVAPWAFSSFETVEWIERVYGEVPGADWVNRRLYYDATAYMPDQILNMVDRASMAVSLELRVPLLDVRLVEFMAGVRGSRKIAEGDGKVILKRAMKGKLPPEIFTRRKLGFGMPVIQWIESPQLRGLLADLPRGPLVTDGYVERAPFETWLGDTAQLKSNWQFLWNLIMLDLWIAQFVKGERRPTPSA